MSLDVKVLTLSVRRGSTDVRTSSTGMRANGPAQCMIVTSRADDAPICRLGTASKWTRLAGERSWKMTISES